MFIGSSFLKQPNKIWSHYFCSKKTEKQGKKQKNTKQPVSFSHICLLWGENLLSVVRWATTNRRWWQSPPCIVLQNLLKIMRSHEVWSATEVNTLAWNWVSRPSCWFCCRKLIKKIILFHQKLSCAPCEKESIK